MKLDLVVNDTPRSVEVDEAMPLLWVLRETLGLTGTKYGCGIGACGACTVHVNGRAMRSCTVPAHTVAGADVTTIEGLGAGAVHPVQQAWLDAQVPQCGYCQPGLIMAAAALLDENPDLPDAEFERALTNLCRCGTYTRVRAALRGLRSASRRWEG